MSDTPTLTAKTLFVRRPLNLGDLLHLLEIVAVLTAVIGGWYRFDYRVSRLEDTQSQQTPILRRIGQTLDKLDDQLIEYPPHRHEGPNIEYPAGTTPPVVERNGNQ
jgi:hypothetical protein